ncbi:MAG: hypothetical protein IJQ02_08575 [Oscillospiraceae bacterium]|nr:hypothetical protein [Oscillospiraceae bacterium]
MMQKNERQYEHDPQKLARAGTSAFLRLAVALYLFYLAYQIIRGVTDGSSSMSPVIAWIAALFFLAAALAFCLYTWKRYRADTAAARLPAEEKREGTETEA